MLLLTAPVLSACRDVGLFAVNFPTRFADVERVDGIVFDTATGLKLDLYRPADTGMAGKQPVLMFFYGGGWNKGVRDAYRFFGTTMAEAGYLVVIADYRKYPEVIFPTFIEDGARAVAWVAQHITDYGGDAEDLWLSGHSAGAHLGAMLVGDARYLAAHGLKPTIFRAFAGLAGPYHFTPEEEIYRKVFAEAAADDYRPMQVSHFVTGDEPPMLLQYGLADDLVGLINIERLEAALDRVGTCRRIKLYPEIDHIGIVSAFTWLYRNNRPVMADMLGFFQDVRREQGCAESAGLACQSAPSTAMASF